MEKLTAVNFSWSTAALSCICPQGSPTDRQSWPRSTFSNWAESTFREVYSFLLRWKPESQARRAERGSGCVTKASCPSAGARSLRAKAKYCGPARIVDEADRAASSEV